LMATRYVRLSGADSNNGTTPALAWRTVTKALGATGIASGDIVYIGGGTYRETVSVAMTSPTVETRVVGDVDGSQTGDAGPVQITAYTTNDTTAPATVVTFDFNSKNYLTVENILFVGGNPTSNASGVNISGNNNKLINCAILAVGKQSGGYSIYISCAANVASTILIDRCRLLNLRSQAIYVVLPRNASAHYDAAVTIRNCCIVTIGNDCVQINPSGTGSFYGGGVDVESCTLFGQVGLRTITAELSTTIPCTINNSLVISGASTGILATTSGQITENYNRIWSATPRSNVTAGANSVTDNAQAMLLEFGQSLIWGDLTPRDFLEPMTGSPVLGFGNTASSPTPPTTDLTGRPRPSGGASTSYAVGAFERHDTGVIDTGSNSDGGSGGHLRLTGPADHDLAVPVDAVSTTLTIKVAWDTNHGNTTKPQIILLAAPELGVTEQTVTATGTAGSAYETLTTSAFTPTAAGVVILRLRSRSGAGNGIARFDTVTM
ncbi:MAG: hypothetical protein H0W46_10645, partial [Acidimicrobiia bacterium]|nr:hypothetical protein [Acidimicrobiia bacterium]